MKREFKKYILIVLLAIFYGWNMSIFHANVSAQDEHVCSDHDDHRAEEKESHEGHDHGEGEEESHEGHDYVAEERHESEGSLRLTLEQCENYGIDFARVGSGSLTTEIYLPGEITVNEDRVAHLSPRLGGTVRKVYKTLGDSVKAGEILLVLDSRELADIKAEFVAAKAWLSLAQAEFEREKKLKLKKISSEQEFLSAQAAVLETEIEFRSLKQKLFVLGFTNTDLKNLIDQPYTDLLRYEIIAPIDGTIIFKHASLGENIEENTEIFTVADLSNVWVNLMVYPKDLSLVQVGQKVTIKSEHNGGPILGTIAMVTPFVDAVTRTATTRVVIDNSSGSWLPGTFVSGHITILEDNVPVLIPKTAVQIVAGEEVVFFEKDGVFVTALVKTGRSDRKNVEILSGLECGKMFVSEGAFNLKATMVTRNLDPHAGHGH
ncbi:efflux RND transporter periplasmic adaptor subunit [bacterium]|nr:efflux RND transporter periplasmic adaptor subunit [bacterium]